MTVGERVKAATSVNLRYALVLRKERTDVAGLIEAQPGYACRDESGGFVFESMADAICARNACERRLFVTGTKVVPCR